MSATTFYNNQKLVGIGSVGIGTTNPSYALDIAGQPRYSIQPLLQTTSYSVTAGATAGWYRIASFGPTVRAKIRIITSGGNLQEQVTVTATWSAAYSGGPTVRIEDQSSATFAGTCPLLNGQIRTLVYVASNGTWYLEVYLGSVVTAYTFYVYLIEGDASGGSITLTNPIVAGSIPTNYTAYPIPVNSFSVTPWGSSNPAIFVSYTGSVGIGTASPTTNLQVLGTAAVGGQSYTGSPSLYVSNVTTTSNASIGLQTGGGSMFHATAYYTGSASWMGLGGNGATAPTQGVINITNGGNVGIGVTNPTYLLDMSGGDIRTQNGGNVGGAGGAINFGANVGYGPMAQIKGALDTAAGSVNDQGSVVFLTRPQEVYPYTVRTNLTERMRITSAGYVGIGTAGPVRPLHVIGETTLTPIGGSAGQYFINVSDSNGSNGGSCGLTIRGLGSSGTAGLNLSYINLDCLSLFVAYLGTGTVYSSSGTLTNTNPSDARLKTNVQSLATTLDTVSNLNPVSFDWIDAEKHGSGTNYGFIAQQVQEVIPDIVRTDPVSGDIGYDPVSLIPFLTGAIKELSDKVAALEQRLAAV